MKRKVFIETTCFLTLFILGFSLISCSNDIEDEDFVYSEIEYIGFYGGLNSFSSAQEFNYALNNCIDSYLNSTEEESTEEDLVVNSVNYEFLDVKPVTGGVPKSVIDLYNKSLKEYNTGIGSCWAFVSVEVPSKSSIGTVYYLLTIITNTNNEFYYKAMKGTLYPKK